MVRHFMQDASTATTVVSVLCKVLRVLPIDVSVHWFIGIVAVGWNRKKFVVREY